MNGLAALLTSVGDAPEVLGMAGRPPGTAEKATDADGFLGILQQMIAGSVQVASLMSMLPAVPVLPVQGSSCEGGGTPPQVDPGGQLVISVGENSGATEQQSTPTFLSLSPQGTSPPATLEVDLPPPSLSAILPAVEEQLASADPPDRVTVPPSEATTHKEVAPRLGGITVPIATTLSADDASPQISVAEIQKPAETSTATEVPVSAADGEFTRRNGKAATPALKADPQTTRKGGSSAKFAIAPLLRSTQQSQGESRVGEHNQQRNSVDVPARNEQTQENRTVRSPLAVADAGMNVEHDAGVKVREVSHAEPMPARTAVAEEEVPVKASEAPVTSEEIPAKAVATTKPVFESTSHDGEAAKNPLPHMQTQITSVRPSVSRWDSGTPRFTDVMMQLPAETVRNVVNQVVKEAALQVRGETSEMRITLVPASLGEVKLSVRMEGGQMQAQIDVSHAAVKAALEVNMGQLKDALSSHGIEVQRLDVYHNGQSLAGDARGNQGDRPRQQGGRHHSYVAESVEQYATGRMLGYNTMEVVM